MGKRPVKVSDPLHEALKEMQREFKKQQGVEPSLGDLIEKAFTEDPELNEIVEDKKREREQEKGSVWDEDFMKL